VKKCQPRVCEILFEDDDIVVVDKPAGRPVHPSPEHEENALTEELVRTRPQMAQVGSAERPGVVHRLDIGTSGVMVFAKTQRAYLKLRREFESHRNVRKTYLAILHGTPKPAKGTLDGPVGRDHLRAITHWQVLSKHGGLALVQFDIETGRMHQIRIHAAELGCPIVGDTTYGDTAKDRAMRRKPTRPLLHAVRLGFLHPTTGKKVSFTASPPVDLVYAG